MIVRKESELNYSKTENLDDAIDKLISYKFNDDFDIIYTYFKDNVPFIRPAATSWFIPSALIEDSIVEYSDNLPEWSKPLVIFGAKFHYVYHTVLTVNGYAECTVIDGNVEYPITTMNCGEFSLDRVELKGIVPVEGFSRKGLNNYITCCLVPKAKTDNFDGYMIDAYTLQSSQTKTISISPEQKCIIYAAKNAVAVEQLELLEKNSVEISGLSEIFISSTQDMSMGIIVIK